MNSISWPKDEKDKERVFIHKCNFKYKANECIEIQAEDYDKKENQEDITK